ncbi:MAG: hypothetical protein M1832_003370 [Thelocarpon impressellum]|nr:MAG: hypothetical protein M1832_003370 [Thelocarpon impressellum]
MASLERIRDVGVVQPSSEPIEIGASTMTATETIRAVPKDAKLPRAASYTYIPSLSRPRTKSDASRVGERAHGNKSKSRRQSEDPGRIRISSFATAIVGSSPDTSYKPPSPTKTSNGTRPSARTAPESLGSTPPRPRSPRPKSPSSETQDEAPSPSPEPPISGASPPRPSTSHASEKSSVGSGFAKSSSRSIKGMSMRGSALLKTKRSSSLLPKHRRRDGSPHSTPPLPFPKSMSTDRLPTLTRIFTSERLTPIQGSVPPEKLQSSGLDVFRKKDELWSAFRSLDHDFHKFQSKSTSLKANVVRSSLLPFLVAYADHPSNWRLRPEDLDRRINILNRWWIGLLDMLNGSQQTLSGTDRPVLLDGIAGIMTRVEWRLFPSLYAPLDQQYSRDMTKSSRTPSSTSLASSASDFISESIHHNIRNLFVQNLLTQTAIVVEKLSLKAAPASLVAFGSKAMAYAFYFCPGVAEILVRLWDTPPDSVRRVLKEFGVRETPDVVNTAENLASGFPDCLRGLTFRSFASTVKDLRRRPALPPSHGNINWNGPWIGRWRGRDSDLFFGFVKQWHVLLGEFLPAGLAKGEKACAPSFVLIHAQVLTILDSTIHRQHPTAQDIRAAPITFDDVLGDPNASAAALPLPSGNFARLMAENRMIMLVRDILSERSSVSDVVRHNFAQAFVGLLQAAVQRISLFNHNACFTLCDFLEECATILIRYQKASPLAGQLLDWGFWLSVCTRMADSQNTMSELRLFAFLYSIWGLVAAEGCRKKGICEDWLLSEATFEKYFSHWCPVVRAYYMRLLCWRVARCDGEASEVDVRILEIFSDRLKSVWSSYLRACAAAEDRRAMPPSTAPCSPAPGRRLLIVRSDTQVDPNLLSSLNSLGPQPSALQSQPNLRRLSAIPLSDDSAGRGSARGSSLPPPEQGAKKRWGLLRNIRSLSSPSSSSLRSKPAQTEATAPPQSGDEKPLSQQNGTAGAAEPPIRNVDVHHSFRFSLEWAERPHAAGKERRLYPPRLPKSAQNLVKPRRSSAEEEEMEANKGQARGANKYAGRALAEWALVVGEYQSFFDRRRAEGVKTDGQVETPTLGMDAFRKFG